ncbi:MAG: hypothetical protein IJD74_04715, partial [Clostridia bacterium]|nr:hypothetical protein [Clostridia bacterium]
AKLFGKSFALSPTPPLPLQKLPVKWARRSRVELPIRESATRAKAAPQVPFWEKFRPLPHAPSPTSKTSCKMGKEVESGTADWGERHTCQSRTAGAFLGKGFLSPSCTHPDPSKTSQKKAFTNFEFCNHFY